MGQAPRIINAYAQAPRWVYVEWQPLEEDADIGVNRTPPFPPRYSVGWISATSFTDQSCEPGKKYEYQVCAQYQGEAQPACSDKVSVTTPTEESQPSAPFNAPTITSITPSSDAIDLAWVADHNFDKYHLWWGLEGTDGQQLDINVSGNHGSYHFAGLKPNTAYHLKLQGGVEDLLGSKWSYWSSVYHIRTLPPPPPPLPTLRAPIHSGFVIQSQNGLQGNFEALVPLAGGLAHFWRDNDAGMVWRGPFWADQQQTWIAASLIESNFIESGRVGNLEALAVRKGPLDAYGTLYHFVRSPLPSYHWVGTPIVADGKPLDTVIGAPALIQGHSGQRGNFEALVPLVGGLAHVWRDNDAPDRPWHGPLWVSRIIASPGHAPYFPGVALIQSNWGFLEALVVEQNRGEPTGALYHVMRWADGSWHTEPVIADGQPVTSVIGPPSLIQGTYGKRGNFEALVPLTDGLAHFWRDNDANGYPWHGPVWINKRQPGGPAGGTIFRVPTQTVAASLFESNYGDPGNLEGLAVWQATISPTGWLTHFVRGGPQWAEADIKPNGQAVDTVIPPDALWYIPSRQGEWRWCFKCQSLFFNGGGASGACPAGGAHDGSKSGNYALVMDAGINAGQNGWRWCHKCAALFFGGAGSNGVCAAGGAHDPNPSSDYRLGGSARDCAGQNGWRWCHKCQGLFFSGASSNGVCPAGGAHDGSTSGDYHLTGFA